MYHPPSHAPLPPPSVQSQEVPPDHPPSCPGILISGWNGVQRGRTGKQRQLCLFLDHSLPATNPTLLAEMMCVTKSLEIWPVGVSYKMKFI